MLCQRCNETQATVQFTLTINGQRKDMKLCHECYAKEKKSIGSGFGANMTFPGFPFEDLFMTKGFSQSPNLNGQFAPQSAGKTKNGGFIDQFGRNLTQMAKAGLIDPVVGRDDEVKRVIEILNRRNKNNPVLIGKPGVGKTAIAEGLALKIAEGDVPGKLQNKEVYLLDVASLVANTGIRGQFEERMKQLIAELQERKNIILFIDEIHQLVGAGSAEGSMDARNILKPALARGELQVVGATTLKEYRQIEKDSALDAASSLCMYRSLIRSLPLKSLREFRKNTRIIMKSSIPMKPSVPVSNYHSAIFKTASYLIKPLTCLMKLVQN